MACILFSSYLQIPGLAMFNIYFVYSFVRLIYPGHVISVDGRHFDKCQGCVQRSRDLLLLLSAQVGQGAELIAAFS